MSYANVMSTVAVVLALGGGAYAASKTTSKTIKNNTIKSIDQKDGKAVAGVDVVPDSLTGGQILESSLGQVPSALSAATAGRATTAGSATTAVNANRAEFAENGVLGWALITDTGDALSADNVLDTQVSNPTDGITCFDGLSFDPRVVLVAGNVQFTNEAQDNFFAASAAGDSAGCAGDEDAVVESRDDDPAGAAALQDAYFFVVFLG